MDAKEYLKSIDCFNTIYLKRDKDSNTMAKIMENYTNEVVKKINYTHCCKSDSELLCDKCNKENHLQKLTDQAQDLGLGYD